MVYKIRLCNSSRISVWIMCQTIWIPRIKQIGSLDHQISGELGFFPENFVGLLVLREFEEPASSAEYTDTHLLPYLLSAWLEILQYLFGLFMSYCSRVDSTNLYILAKNLIYVGQFPLLMLLAYYCCYWHTTATNSIFLLLIGCYWPNAASGYFLVVPGFWWGQVSGGANCQRAEKRTSSLSVWDCQCGWPNSRFVF